MTFDPVAGSASGDADAVGRGDTPPDRGLTRAEVEHRVADGRTNRFRPRASRGVASIVRANVFTLFNGIIAVCFVALLAFGRWQDALFGFSALGNLLIGSWQELRAKVALDRLTLPSSPTAHVIRDGAELLVPSEQVVVDEVIVVRGGDRIPADARVLDAARLQVDESLLTGESDAVDKSAGESLLGGSLVVAGEARAVVERVGASTFANSLASQARRFSLVASELHAGIRRVLRWVAIALGPIVVLLLPAQVVALGGWSALGVAEEWRSASVFAIAAVVAMIPLGLVLMTSLAFAVGAVRLAREQVLVQELAAIEVLARVDVICFDKTGTLTEGGVGFEQEIPLLPPDAQPPGWRAALAWFASLPDANATAQALATAYAHPVQESPRQQLAFSSDRKWSAVGFAAEAPGTWLLGAPDVLMPGGALAARTSSFAESGRRTLLLAHTAMTLSHDGALPAGVRPVALLVFRERIRADAADTLAYFAREGIGIRVLSGDDPRTVAAIARDVGIPVTEAVDARTLPSDPVGLAEAVERNLVFGRITPDQKRELTRALQASGHTVAMIGDGINDIPALKRADIGIAMSSGAPAARAVARMVVVDGRFSRLPAVVAEWRRVLANIERVSMLFFTKTTWAVALAVLAAVFVVGFPFLPRQLSVLDGLTIGLPAFLLALLPNARPYRVGFLRRSLAFAVPAGLAIALTLAGFAAGASWLGVPAVEVRTAATLILGIAGLWVLALLCRPFGVRETAVLVLMAVGLAGVFVIRPVREFLELAELSPTGRLVAALAALLAVGLIELGRRLRAWAPWGSNPRPTD